MPRVPLVFGGGLDRETGVMAMQPGGMEDLRNVHILEGKFQVRRGFEEVLTFTDGSGNAQTDVLGAVAIKGRRAAVYVTYDSVNYKVNVFVGDATASWVSWLAEWVFEDDASNPLLSSSNPDPPVVMLAELNGIVMMAHCYGSVDFRAQTQWLYWDETAGAYSLNPLVQDGWSTSNPTNNIRFRGVTKHLDYMVGWGFGDNENDAPEIVRFSFPGLPLSDLQNDDAFDELSYMNPGDEGDAVIACYSAGETLICFKESETWEIYGDNGLEFGQRPLDGLYGMEQPRLAVSVEGAVFAWTTEGPRIFAGDGTSESLELPLELYNPEPYDLPSKGSDTYAFAVYMPVYRSIWFFFNRRVYALYIRVPGKWRWGYHDVDMDTMSAWRLPQAGWGTTTPPVGYPSMSAVVAGDTTAELTWSNTDQVGDETVEVWAKPAGGSWSLHSSWPVEAGATQDEDLGNVPGGKGADLKMAWDYDVAVRYRRGPYYTFGYESSNPDLWPSSSRASFSTTANALPTINSGVWSRTSAVAEQVLLSITPPSSGVGSGYDIEIRRGAVLIHTEENVSGQFSYADTGCSGEADNVYDCRLVTPYVNGAYTADTTVWGGPLGPTITLAEAGTLKYTLEWSNALSAYTEVYDSLPSELEVDVLDNLRYTENPDQWEHIGSEIPGSSGLQPWCAVRHKVTTYGVDDYSDHSAMQLDGTM